MLPAGAVSDQVYCLAVLWMACLNVGRIVAVRTYDSHMGRQRIYVNERGDCVVNDTGFSWFAALLSPVWALQKRLYLVALALFASPADRRSGPPRPGDLRSAAALGGWQRLRSA